MSLLKIRQWAMSIKMVEMIMGIIKLKVTLMRKDGKLEELLCIILLCFWRKIKTLRIK